MSTHLNYGATQAVEQRRRAQRPVVLLHRGQVAKVGYGEVVEIHPDENRVHRVHQPAEPFISMGRDRLVLRWAHQTIETMSRTIGRMYAVRVLRCYSQWHCSMLKRCTGDDGLQIYVHLRAQRLG